MNTLLTKVALLGLTVFLFASCGEGKKQFEIKGVIANADTLTLYLERRGHSDVTILDSVTLKNDGNFSFKEDALDYSEFYRLRLKNQNINLVVDSTEIITITGNYATLSVDYNIEGSSSSQQIKEAVLAQAKFNRDFNKLKHDYANKSIDHKTYTDSLSSVINRYKERGRNLILDDYKSMAAYFTLFQRVDNMLVFDPSDKSDLSLFRAVATVWDTYYPKSPRTAQLKNYTLQAIASMKTQENQQKTLDKLVNSETTDAKNYFVVSLPNAAGKEVSTADMKGKIVLLDFTAYQSENSVAHNIILNKVYEKHKSKIEIYQVSLDKDKHSWQNAADNLPWTCVRDGNSSNSSLLPRFNIRELPTTFILNKEGDIVKRLSAGSDISAEVAKVL